MTRRIVILVKGRYGLCSVRQIAAHRQSAGMVPWHSEKVGFRLCSGTHVHWDDFLVTTNRPGKVVTADDCDAWGYILEGRRFVMEDNDTCYNLAQKERDVESQYDYFGARYYDSRIGRWLSADPKSDLSAHLSPYVYASGNPIARVDPDGEKDRLFDAKTDRPISRKPGTATPMYIYGQDGRPMAYAPNYESAYNCHSFAWHNSQGDPTDPGNKSLVDAGITKWDNSPADDIPERGAVQLKPDADNRLGDRVVYYVDKDANGKYDSGEEIVHSAIVETVDKEGYTTEVIGKMGQQEISVNHPDAPGYYRTNQSGQRTARAYFRVPEKKENEEVKP